jgi:hypothetical protein
MDPSDIRMIHGTIITRAYPRNDVRQCSRDQAIDPTTDLPAGARGGWLIRVKEAALRDDYFDRAIKAIIQSPKRV